MSKILYLTSTKESIAELKSYIARESDMEILPEFSSGAIMPKLMEKFADVLLISDSVFKEKTADFVRTLRQGLPWYLQIPIIVIADSDTMTETRTAELYTAGANYVRLLKTDARVFWSIVRGQIDYTDLLKSNNRMAMRHI